MGVTYKLRDEVVQFIISQRQESPFSSCRQLAESASQKFGLHLSKSSVHDVLKESGITTPRGRKPKDKFEIPQEKKKQIQKSLAQVKLLPVPVSSDPVTLSEMKDINRNISLKDSSALPQNDGKGEDPSAVSQNDGNGENSLPETPGGEEPSYEILETSPEYQGAGKIFLKAARWDQGIFSEERFKEEDGKYYLTYAKGIKVCLESGKEFFIELLLPIERCIREVTDGLINNIRPIMVDNVSDQELFRACMEAQSGFKIENIEIMDQTNRVLFEINNIMEIKRAFELKKRVFVESGEVFSLERADGLFFSQMLGNKDVINNILNLNGFDIISKRSFVVNLLVDDNFNNKKELQGAAEKLNSMYIYDEQGRVLSVNIGARM